MKPYNIRRLIHKIKHNDRRYGLRSISTKIAQILIGIILSLIGILTLVIYIPSFPVSHLEWFAGNQIFRLGLLLLSVLFLLHYIAAKRLVWTLLSALFILILLIEAISYIPFTEPNRNEEARDCLSVMAFNSERTPFNYSLYILRNMEVDLVCFQEVRKDGNIDNFNRLGVRSDISRHEKRFKGFLAGGGKAIGGNLVPRSSLFRIDHILYRDFRYAANVRMQKWKHSEHKSYSVELCW